MFLELETIDEFRKAYFSMLKSRLTQGSLEVEKEDERTASANQAMKLFQQNNALNYAFSVDVSKMSHYDFLTYLIEIANRLTSSAISNFRTTDATVNGSKVIRTRPEMIRNDLFYLIDDYNYQINEYKKYCEECLKNDVAIDKLKLFEIEAQFHIRLLYIHPFGDCNGRTSRIVLTRNLCEYDEAPCVLTKENKREYCDYIENGDTLGLAEFFRHLSKQELYIMLALYNELLDRGSIEEVKHNPEDGHYTSLVRIRKELE